MFDLICKEHNCNIVVYGKSILSKNHENQENDLKDDLFSIINVFVASHNEERNTLLKKRKKLKNKLSND